MKNITSRTLSLEIKELLYRAKSKVYQTINSTMTSVYWEIGKKIVEEDQQGSTRAKYGKSLIKNLSIELTKEFGKGFSGDNLENMRRFYLAYSKSETASRKFELSWSHYIFLSRMINQDERHFYEIEAVSNSWSLRELKRQFNSGLHERLLLGRDTKKVLELSSKGQLVQHMDDLIKDPYILEFVGLPELVSYSESDLKIGELKHQDIGQMMMYVNYFDRVEKTEDENKTIGIILCKDKSKALVEMTLPEDNNQIYASKYLTILPDKKTFQRLLESEDE